MTPDAPDMIADLYKSGMRRLASGVSLITSADATSRVGLIATAVNSVSMEPPTLLICVNQTASAHDVIDRQGCFCVNILTVEEVELANQFSTSARRHERFGSGDWDVLETGAPVLSNALVAFDCSVVHRIPYQTHTIFLGRVLSVKLPEEVADPLLYLNRSFRRAVVEAVG